jgi:ligand-binding SRPBCC domain-containing protein
MKVYHLRQQQFLPLTLQEAWTFFSSPVNLVKITPTHMDFKILHTSGDGSGMYAGQIISYKIKLLPFIYVNWVTEITHVKHHEYFVDNQITGPYSIWHHQHHFTEVPGGVQMTDEITYAVPFGIIGRFANYLFIEQQLKTIFAYRHTVLGKMFANTDLAITKST